LKSFVKPLYIASILHELASFLLLFINLLIYTCTNANKKLTRISTKMWKNQCSYWLSSFLILSAFLINYISSTSVLSNSKWDQDESQKSKYKIVCYYTNWAQYRPKPATYFPDNVDPNLCTHVIFAFAKINDDLELARFRKNSADSLIN
jgi:hypothetical protein